MRPAEAFAARIGLPVGDLDLLELCDDPARAVEVVTRGAVAQGVMPG